MVTDRKYVYEEIKSGLNSGKGVIIFKLIVEKYGVIVWTGFIRLTIRTTCVLALFNTATKFWVLK